MTRLILFLITFALVLPLAGNPVVAPSAIEAIVAELVKPGGPGCSVAVSESGRLLFSRGFGLADVEHNVAITPATRFESASITKQFTAAAVLLLAQEGKLSLQDDVRKYIPELPQYTAPVTLHHLLTHTSGVRDYSTLHYMQGWFPFERRQFKQSEVLRDIVRQRHLNFRPGSAFAYSNSGYVLAASIVERVSGESFRSFLQKRFFQPLGMKSTDLREDFRRVFAPQAFGYGPADGGFIRYPQAAIYGPSGIISTAEDLLLWNSALDTAFLGPFVTAELQREAILEDGQRTGYARGLELRHRRGVDEVGHGGTTDGFSTMLLRYPQQKLSVAVLCNGGAPAPPVALRIADLHLKGTTEEPAPAPPAAAIVLKPEEAARYAGVFLDDLRGLPVTIVAEAGALKWGRRRMEPVSPDQFRMPGADVAFKTRDLVEVRTASGAKLTFRRVDGPHPTAVQRAAMAGQYRNEDALTTYAVVPEGDTLVLRVMDGPEFELKLNPIGPDLFENDGDIIRFVRNREGKVEAFLFNSERLKDLRFDRKSPAP